MLVRRWLVCGRVQGVFFRLSTKREAARLGLTRGHALNTVDGKVDVFAAGLEAQLSALEKWLWVGPAGADVTDVKVFVEPATLPENFVTG